ncbi:hypothetical protein HK16_19285 [Acetobacter senegalensis]|uniref:Uncharacterized protein n=2 Tax=Acetobacter TaxID=434 RepID=A0A252EF41_9PROT|nr:MULTISPECIES: hypothetical protein [Acetobacter]ATJ89729.1 hypothetical protein CIW82_02475 [Acetobacter tropicalis]MCC6105782.1 hypothetical protein [Acetobacter sp.]MCG4257350.1 hypothetical protein [Acetobacter senegalensis]MCG4267448.1 hypothetical protein [Acetobacter senegalensis]MCG4273231.1 hypothetical protein [Acetobacter senegalensis]
MSIFRTSLPHSGKASRPSVTVLLKTFGKQFSQAFSARGMLQLGMLEGIVATLDENARRERLHALYPTSRVFGGFAEGPAATAMQQNPAQPR